MLVSYLNCQPEILPSTALPMERILIVDDDVDLYQLVTQFLEPEGFEVEAAHDGPKGLERALSGDYSLIVLDLMLPDMGGLDVLRNLRLKSNVPVLILTARGEDVDRIVGLEIGADDYLPKPFSPRELQARIRAILRRGRAPAAPEDASLRFGRLQTDRASRMVRVDGEEKTLTSYQF